jgi:PIN domain nuclease of toxin-antitoxin system
MKTMTVGEFKSRFSEALDAVRDGETIVEDLVGTGRQMGLTISAPSAEEAAGFYRLPKVAHKDPFDRMLIWQCLQRRWTLITRDRGLSDYKTHGLLTDW